MKSNRKKNIIKAVLFLAIAALLFAAFVQIFHFKYSKATEQFFHLPKNTVDVLIVGSSHSYHNFNPDVLYKESGIAAYAMGSDAQTIWNSYYFIKEALKKQKPKLVILECYKTYFRHEYSDTAVAVKSACNMPFSMDYIQNLYVSLEDKSLLPESILMFPWYHNRYAELESEDFLPHYGKEYYENFLGFKPLRTPVEFEEPGDIAQIKTRKPLTEKTLEYLDKTVALCREKETELVFVISPFYRRSERLQPYYNTLSDYAKEKHVPLLNANLYLDELNLDAKTDFGTGCHLSFSGVNKFMHFLNQYLEKNYALPDRRGDARYSRWEKHRQYMNRRFSKYYES